MNTIGNLGGAAASYVTGRILDLTNGSTPSPAGAERGWTINFLIFTGVYVTAAILWLFIDSTRPVVPDDNATA
jgi:hypothetical protein